MISDFRITEKAAICTQEIRDRITGYLGYNLSIMKNEFQIFVNFLTDQVDLKICENSDFVPPEDMW